MLDKIMSITTFCITTAMSQEAESRITKPMPTSFSPTGD